MNDPLGVHSAVLGMLSLSQGNPNSNNQLLHDGGAMYHHQAAAMHLSHSPSTATHETHGSHQGGMPLTPPGSPEEQKKLVVAEGRSPAAFGVGVSGPSLLAQTLAQNTQASAETFGYAIGAPTAGLAGFAELPSTSSSQNSSPFSQLFGSEFVDNPILSRALQQSVAVGRRSRSEKKPIPDDSKDDKYFERRRRNNVAAKKSRDTRKSREDEIAVRAAYLERENAVLRAQVGTLRDEAQSLRTLLIQKRQRQMQMQMCGGGPINANHQSQPMALT